MNPPDVLYCAPGSGLGHLNRALAVCLELRDMGVSARIVTNSPFAAGLARTMRFPITGIVTQTWREDVRAYMAAVRPRLMVCDTFPRGMRGEWEDGIPVPCVYVARRLNPAAVGTMFADAAWSRGMVRTIAAETLGAEHEAVLTASGVPVVRLPGPVRLRPGVVAPPVPAELNRILDTGCACLVVHGGPIAEVEQLVELAQGRGELAVITPWGARSFEYFPAGNLMERAAHVVTGAGYNAMADMMFRRDHHTAVAFPRRFDDQSGRLSSWRNVDTDGTRQAAEAVAAVLGSTQ